MEGAELSFSEQDLRASAAAYDPSLHEAPLVVGHPQHNLPAYGWVSGLSFADDKGLEAEPSQVDPAFSEMVNAGRFKKISASFYTPNSPSNPVPGIYYLRHVGFLGAMPPAVKGLRDAAFAEGEEGVVEFHDAFGQNKIARLFRRLREWLIDTQDVETADRILPEYDVKELEDEAQQAFAKLEDQQTAPGISGFLENPDGSTAMTEEELKAEKAKIADEKEKLEKAQADFAELQKKAQDAERGKRLDAYAEYAEELAAAGKIVPAQKPRLIALMAALDSSGELSFSEGDKEQNSNAVEALKGLLDAKQAGVHFGEFGGGDDDCAPVDSRGLSEKAVAYQEEQRRNGVDIDIVRAVRAVSKT